jgi:hypothetical protein
METVVVILWVVIAVELPAVVALLWHCVGQAIRVHPARVDRSGARYYDKSWTLDAY